jgi:hypothetical protein
MRIFPLTAALLAALTVSEASAQRLPCTGTFAQCAYSVGAYCTRDNDGVQRIHYWDSPGNTMMFERCVGGIFEAAGQPNPYTTGRMSSGRVSMPRFELHYPVMPDNER